jgi:hypothetical protein
MFTTRVCPSQKSQKNENGWGKSGNNFPFEGIHRVLLHPTNSGLNICVSQHHHDKILL